MSLYNKSPVILRNTSFFNSHLKNQIIQEMYFSDTVTCNDLSEALGRSIPLISKTVYELIQEGFILEKGLAPSQGGRPPLMYSLKPGNMYILAISMDQLYTQIALVDMFHRYAHPVKTFELRLLNNHSSMEILLDEIQLYFKKYTIDLSKIIGIGIGMPGFVNNEKGINYSYLLPASGETMRSCLERAFQIPVYIENDSNMVALAELKFGLAKGKENVMVINIGWGIGLGMIMNGGLFVGHDGYAGELSHIPISESNTLCECGKRGCLETEASLRVVATKAIEEIKNGKISNLQATDDVDQMVEFIMEAALNGDQYALELLSGIGEKIGKAAAILTHIVNPELILISGRGAKVGKLLKAPMQQALDRYCIPRMTENLEIKVSKLGNDSGLISAAALVVQKFGDPVLQD
jgi:predicted NBD/HSP70 family sugar kinase